LIFLIDDIEVLLEVAAIRTVGTLNVDLLGWARSWSSTSYDSNTLWLTVKLCSSNLDLTFSGRVRSRVVVEVDGSRLKAKEVALEGTDVNLRVGLDDINHILEVDRAVTLNLKLLGVLLTDCAAFSHINKFGEKLILV